MFKKEEVKNGLIAGFLGTLCCTLPLAIIVLAIFFGIGSVTLGLYIGYYGEVFLALGLIFLTISTYFYLKKRNCCNIYGAKQHWKTIAFSLTIMFLVYITVKYFIVPYLVSTLVGG